MHKHSIAAFKFEAIFNRRRISRHEVYFRSDLIPSHGFAGKCYIFWKHPQGIESRVVTVMVIPTPLLADSLLLNDSFRNKKRRQTPGTSHALKPRPIY